MFSAHDGNGWRVARALVVLSQELNRKWPDWICQGTVGDLTHQEQAGYSDHNPVVKDPKTGVGIVRAIDIKKDNIDAEWLFNYFQKLYNQHDPRLYPFGYAKMDGRITVWDDNPNTTEHPDAGDYGHIHLSLNQKSYPSVPTGYVPAVDSLAGWGIAGAVSVPVAPGVVSKPGVPTVPSRVPPWPLQGSHYFGLITGPEQSHGGFYPPERPYVKMIQQRLQALGYAPKTTGWADGIFEQPTADAVAKWQRAKWARYTEFYGQVWADDWVRLFS